MSKNNVYKIRNVDEELDKIYDFSDNLMKRERWIVIETIFEYIMDNIKNYQTEILVGWATATLAGKHRIINRQEFLDKCKELHPDEELWKGLD